MSAANQNNAQKWDRRVLAGWLAALASVILLVDAYWIIQAGVTAANAAGAVVVAIGSVALLIRAIDGVKNRPQINHHLFTAGTVCLAVGGVVIAIAAVMGLAVEMGATSAS